MFLGTQSHAFSCKHETHDLLTRASYIFVYTTYEAFYKLNQSFMAGRGFRPAFRAAKVRVFALLRIFLCGGMIQA